MLSVRILALLVGGWSLTFMANAQNAANVAQPVATPPPAVPVVTPAPGTTPVQAAPTPTVTQQANGTQITSQQILCPQPNELVKNGFYWGTPTGGWKSYSESFDNTIVSFIGAQWVGVNVGKMICIYKGNLALSFPITVQNDILVPAPSGASWGQDLGGYRNCHSNNLADCPFIVQTKGTNIQQVYESLDFYKSQTPFQSTGGSSLPQAPFFPQ